MAEPSLEGGSYEVIRSRLLATAKALGERAEALNSQRREQFGGYELALIGNDRVRTENNCVARDLVPLGSRLLFGFNVFMGLKQEKVVRDVFSLHRFDKATEGAFDFTELPHSEVGGALDDRRFVKDFEDLFKFYKDARLSQLLKTESRLLAIFQTGATERDVKVLRFALDSEGRATYLDNRGDADVLVTPTHDFEWKRLDRDRHVTGRHPHVNVLDLVFVETVGGDLTIKVENNTESGEGIYSEPVDEPTQSLDDAEFYYSKVGDLVLLKVLPFREPSYRYLIFNVRTQRVTRVDAIGQSCVSLPEQQGVVFPGGYVLQTGEVKLFDDEVKGLFFHRAVRSPNGEDVLFVFFDRGNGRYVLFPYNLVRKEVANPIHGHGYSIFSDGRMLVLKATTEPTRVHPLQVWQTPFVSAEFAAAQPAPKTQLGKLGNAELVRGISEVLTLKRLAEGDHPSRRNFEGLSAACTRVVDQFHWLGQAEVGLLPHIDELRRNSELIVDEFEKVRAMQARAVEVLAEAEREQEKVLRSVSRDELASIDALMSMLEALKRQRGHLITLKETRSIDLARLETLELQVAHAFEQTSQWSLEFLLTPEAFRPLHRQVDTVADLCAQASKTTELEPAVKEVERIGAGLSTLGDVVGGLSTGDPTHKAKILEDISEVFAKLNRVRASVQARRQALVGTEKRTEFVSQLKLFSQSIESALALAATPEQCDEHVAKLSIQLEALDGRFSDLDEFAAELASRRDDLINAFGRRKQVLVDERQRRAQTAFSAAERILESVGRRGTTFDSDDALNSYFAADPMVQKYRQLVGQLKTLNDSVRADELDARLKAAKQEALRSLRDRKDLFEGGHAVVKLGTHRFNVNTQPLEASVIPRGDQLMLQLTGSDFAQPIVDADIDAAKAYWAQTLPSESPEVYRAEYLAFRIVKAAEIGEDGMTLAALHDAMRTPGGLLKVTQAWAQRRYDEGYERGVHDADAAALVEQMLRLAEGAGLLRFPPRPRALAAVFFASWRDQNHKASVQRRALSLGRLRQRYATSGGLEALAQELGATLRAFFDAEKLPTTASEVSLAARYLVETLANEPLRFVVSREGAQLHESLLEALDHAGQRLVFEADLRALESDAGARYRLAVEWLTAHATQAKESPTWGRVVPEAAAMFAVGEEQEPRDVSSALLELEVKGLIGQHPRINGQAMVLRLDELEERMAWFLAERLPAFDRYRAKVHQILQHERARLRLDELKPKVLTSFVRNRLIDEVYLPLIGANLAKQLGVAGEQKRTDRMGLLLLISPPGYGKTTLMEYVASRLGLTFVKVNGPSLGHDVVSVDPTEAPNATARQEVERINLGFELGNNVMLYIDDIQHTNPELLQKFISLCDATRKIEGVWNGKTRTYDLRGKKFCVVMAGNPYTESGERFRIPDMLANRADTYNLGDVLSGKEELFALSYLENALTSNVVTAPLLTRPTKDLHRILEMSNGTPVSVNELEHGYSAAELNEIVEVLKRLRYVQRTLLKVNQEYIRSASQDDRFRTEPPFKLQGSYRNMNKLAEKIVSAMTNDELEGLLDAHYASESQTLTTAAEQNLLKLGELRGRLSDAQRARWEEIRRAFKRVRAQGGGDDDPVVRVTGSIASLGEGLAELKDVALEAARRPVELDGAVEALGAKLEAAAQLVAQRERGAIDLSPNLDALREAIVASQKNPVLDAALVKLTDVVSLLAQRPASAPDSNGHELSSVLEKLATTMSAQTRSHGMSEDAKQHLAQVHHRLNALAELARAALQENANGTLQAVTVWQEVREMLDLVGASGTKRRPERKR